MIDYLAVAAVPIDVDRQAQILTHVISDAYADRVRLGLNVAAVPTPPGGGGTQGKAKCKKPKKHKKAAAAKKKKCKKKKRRK